MSDGTDPNSNSLKLSAQVTTFSNNSADDNFTNSTGSTSSTSNTGSSETIKKSLSNVSNVNERSRASSNASNISTITTNESEIKKVEEDINQANSSEEVDDTKIPDEDINILRIQEMLKMLVIKTSETYLDGGNPSMEDLLLKISSPVFNDSIKFDDFIEKVPKEGLSGKDKILLLMLYYLHNTFFDE